jgi:hypothetical protein
MIYTNPITLRFCTHSKIIKMYVKSTTNTVFCSFLFVGVFLQAKIGISSAWGMYQLWNYPTSKISVNSFWMKICLWVFKIWGFEGGIGVSKCGGPLNSTGVGLLYHQTSNFSLFCLMNQNLLMHVLNLRFRRGNWVPNMRGTLELHRGLDFKSPNIYI